MWYEAFMGRAHGFSLPAWDELPDFGLYMDQVITYLERVYRPLYGDERRIVTPAMINNYVKSGLIGRPNRKKYDRAQVAQLIILCGLKQALSLDNLRLLFAGEGDLEGVYHDFASALNVAEEGFAGQLAHLTPMQSAVMGAAYTLLSEEMLRAEETPTDP